MFKALDRLRCRSFHSSALRAESVSAGDVKEGDLLEIDGGLWRVMSKALSRTAQGRAYVQTEVRGRYECDAKPAPLPHVTQMRHLTEEVKKQMRLRSEDVMERVNLSTPMKFQVLYIEGAQVLVMNGTTFEQLEIPIALFGDRKQYLQDGITLVVESHAGVPVLVHLPPRMTFEVTSLDDGGSTATTSQGFKLRVPKHVKVGDRILVDTSDGRYVSKE